MDYKKILKSRALRLKILKMFNFVPDKIMLKIQYKIKTGNKLDLKNPKRYTEKLQWYKVNYKNPLMIQCVDKYDVREYVKSKGLEEILIPCYGVFDSVDAIDWDAIPNSFVIKDTLGGGGNSVIIVKNKQKADLEKIKEQCLGWLAVDSHKKDAGREWPYYSGKHHRIIIEEYINSDGLADGLIDYKFFCFNGKIEFVQVMGNRALGESVSSSIYDRDLNLLPVKRPGYIPFEIFDKPSNYHEMQRVVELLSQDFPHVRVDTYNINGEIKFGELTFYGASGYYKYDPDKFDFEIGEKFKIDDIS